MMPKPQPSACSCLRPVPAAFNFQAAARFCVVCDGRIDPSAASRRAVALRVPPPAVRVTEAEADAILFEWRNDHGGACSCFACVMNRRTA